MKHESEIPKTKAEQIRILCIDDNQNLSAMLDLFNNEESLLQHVGTTNNLEKALEQIARDQPDIVVVDLSIQGSNPIPTIREINRCFPAIRIILYSNDIDQALVDEAIKVGAFKHVHKEEGVKSLLDTIYSSVEIN